MLRIGININFHTEYLIANFKIDFLPLKINEKVESTKNFLGGSI